MEVKSNLAREYNKYAMLEEGQGLKPVWISKRSKLSLCHEVVKIAFYLEMMIVLGLIALCITMEIRQSQERMNSMDSIADYDEVNSTDSYLATKPAKTDETESILRDEVAKQEQIYREHLDKVTKDFMDTFDLQLAILSEVQQIRKLQNGREPRPEWFSKLYEDGDSSPNEYEDISSQTESKK